MLKSDTVIGRLIRNATIKFLTDFFFQYHLQDPLQMAGKIFCLKSGEILWVLESNIEVPSSLRKKFGEIPP